MCNAWNHSDDCTCGWGGDGHLGQSSGGGYSYSQTSSFFDLNSIAGFRKGGEFPSFLSKNARCPVCLDEVYFYQSEYGGRVFFDYVPYPWTKHPCTDSSLLKKTNVESIWGRHYQLLIYYLHKFSNNEYFALICIKQRKAGAEISGRFLQKIVQGERKYPDHVYLHLKGQQRINISTGALFFIKEVNAAKNLYSLVFLVQDAKNGGISTIHAMAEIGNLIRPVLKNQEIIFKDFSEK